MRIFRLFNLTILLLMIFCFISCNNSTGTIQGKAYIKNGDSEITSFSGVVGEEYDFEFVVENNSNIDTTWTSSNVEILSISIPDPEKSYMAEIKCESVGSATLTASVPSGETASIEVVVTNNETTPPVVYEITSTVAQIVIYDDSYDLPYNYLNTIKYTPSNSEIEYEFSNAKIRLDGDGNIVADETGLYTITARIKGSTDHYVVTEIEVKSARFFTIERENVAIKLGDTTALPISTSFNDLNYRVDNSLVAKIENNNIVPLQKGDTFIRIFRNNIEFGIIKLEVVEDLPSAITVNSIAGEQSFINLYGRNYYDSDQQAAVIVYGGAGFEIKFCGTKLLANLTSRLNTSNLYMQVLVDGEKVSFDSKDILKDSIAINSATPKKYTIIENLPYGVHTVKVLKRSMFNSGEIGLLGVETDGFLMPAPKKPKLKIDIYGDSITAGYGVCDGISWNSENSNGLLTYGYLLTEKLGAQSNMMGHSGWGVYLSTGNNLNPDTQWYNRVNLIPKTNQTYDLSSYVPDLVIINLGTNDSSGVFGGNYNSEEFISKYKTMITTILENAPNAYVILCYGMMGTNSTVNSDIGKVVEQLNNDKVTYLPLENFGCWNGSGENGHPTPAGNKLAADYLYDYIVSNYPGLINIGQDIGENYGDIDGFIKN